MDRSGHRRPGGRQHSPHRGPLKRSAFARCSLALAALVTTAASGKEFDCLIEARQALEIRSPVEGVIESVLVQRGGEVKKGQLIATLFSGPERAALELARSRAVMEGELKAAARA